MNRAPARKGGTIIFRIGRRSPSWPEIPRVPLFPGIAGEPLQALLKVLGDLGGALIYQFMTSPNDALGGLSPLQLLIKEPVGDETAAALLALPDAQQLVRC